MVVSDIVAPLRLGESKLSRETPSVIRRGPNPGCGFSAGPEIRARLRVVPGMAAEHVIERGDFDRPLDSLADRGHTSIGPTAGDNAIVYEEVRRAADLPVGRTDVPMGREFDADGIKELLRATTRTRTRTCARSALRSPPRHGEQPSRMAAVGARGTVRTYPSQSRSPA
jgi:hypothetical protein